MFISMHLILGRASFCMNYCINAAWHGGNQPVALLRCNEAQVALLGLVGVSQILYELQLICIVGSGVSQILHGLQVICIVGSDNKTRFISL